MKRCPFCDGTPMPASTVGFPVSAHCPNCLATGPEKLTGREADAAWDHRPAENALEAKLDEEREYHAWEISPAMAQAKIDELNARVKRLEEFSERLLTPDDLGHAVTAEVRNAARVALGRQAVETTKEAKP